MSTSPTLPSQLQVAAPIRRMQIALDAAIADALDRKRRLGQYAVLWEHDRVVLCGDDAPTDAGATALVAAESTPPWSEPSTA